MNTNDAKLCLEAIAPILAELKMKRLKPKQLEQMKRLEDAACILECEVFSNAKAEREKTSSAKS